MRSMEPWSFTALSLAVLLAFSATAPAQPAAADQPSKPAVTANNAFTFDLYAKLAEGDRNLFFSPYSIESALAMTYGGARGKTADQMAKVLRFDVEAAKLHPAFGALAEKLNTSGQVGKERVFDLVVANALWGQKGYPFQQPFQELVKANYGAGLNDVDFVQATEEARKTINQWVEKQTKDKIKDLLAPGVLTPDTRLVLTNAIYFKSKWEKQFRKEQTKDLPFHLSAEKSVDVPMMNQTQTTGFAEVDGCQVVEMPYSSRRLSMLVVLPTKVDGLAEVEKAITPEKLAQWQAAFRRAAVDLSLPKFHIEAQFSLAPVLGGMGMPDAFSGAADFSGIATLEKLSISAVIHKAYVDVDEQGTEAAAATAVIMGRTAAMQPPEKVTFKADHPFLFVIRHNESGAILFIGRVANPKG